MNWEPLIVPALLVAMVTVLSWRTGGCQHTEFSSERLNSCRRDRCRCGAVRLCKLEPDQSGWAPMDVVISDWER